MTKSMNNNNNNNNNINKVKDWHYLSLLPLFSVGYLSASESLSPPSVFPPKITLIPHSLPDSSISSASSIPSPLHSRSIRLCISVSPNLNPCHCQIFDLNYSDPPTPTRFLPNSIPKTRFCSPELRSHHLLVLQEPQ